MNIVLTGFMGTGKTSTGRILARKLNWPLLDTDEMIEKKTGRSIREIFETDGEPYFRNMEKSVIADVAAQDQRVIATGGGAIIDPANRTRLKKNGVLIALLASPEEIRRRTRDKNCRPILNTGCPEKTIAEVLKRRLPYYRMADYCLDTDRKSPAEVADEIVSILPAEKHTRKRKKS